MEVEELEVLELGARRREQLLADADVGVHRAADVEEQQHLHRVVPLRDHLDVEIARVARRRADRVGQVELDRGALAGELAQPAQRDLDVARAELDRVVEVLELALVPDLDGAAVAVLVLADAHAFGIVAVGAERRGAGRCRSTCCRPGGGSFCSSRRFFSVSISFSQPPSASICAFSSSVSSFSASLRSHSSGISAVAPSAGSASRPLKTWPKTRSNLSRLRLVLHQRRARRDSRSRRRCSRRRPCPCASSSVRYSLMETGTLA